MTDYPEKSPAAEMQAIKQELRELGRDIQIHFEGGDDSGGPTFIAMQSVPPDLSKRVIRVSAEIVAVEIGTDWADGAGATGFIRFDGKSDPYLDADDRANDWTYEREILLDDYEDEDWLSEPSTEVSAEPGNF